MKISKLFHWLYAILMLLPFVFFVPSVLYYAFNDNATMQSVEVPKTETISVDFNQRLNIGGYYTDQPIVINQTVDNERVYNTLGTCRFFLGHTYYRRVMLYRYVGDFGCYIHNSSWLYGGVTISGSTALNTFIGDTFVASRDNDLDSIKFDSSYAVTGSIDVSFSISIFDLTQMFGDGNEPTINEFNQMFPNEYYSYIESELMQITYDTGETMQLVENTSIVNYAWESIWDLPLFSWSKVSFVAVPMTFLTGMFGLASSNSLNYVFAYFVSISIIYLLFDVIMYFPLMVHRWIDKARLE